MALVTTCLLIGGNAYEVIVVGAGVSGIMAARTLQDEGNGDYHVTLLEATDHFGGRSWSNKDAFPGAIGKTYVTVYLGIAQHSWVYY